MAIGPAAPAASLCRLKATNGQTIATGGEGYTTKASAKNGIKSVQKNAPLAEVVEV